MGEARTQGVHADAIGPETPAHGPGHGGYTALCCRVHLVAWPAGDRVNRSDIHDRATSAALHEFGRFLAHEEYGSEIRLPEPFDFIFRKLQEFAFDGDAGVVHQPVDAPTAFGEVLKKLFHFGRVAHVELDGLYARRICCERTTRFDQGFKVHVSQDQ